MELQLSPLCIGSSPHITLCSKSSRRTRGRGGSARRASDRFPKFLDSGIGLGLGASCPPRQHTCLRPFYSLFSSQVTRFALLLLHLICREIICVCISVKQVEGAGTVGVLNLVLLKFFPSLTKALQLSLKSMDIFRAFRALKLNGETKIATEQLVGSCC